MHSKADFLHTFQCIIVAILSILPFFFVFILSQLCPFQYNISYGLIFVIAHSACGWKILMDCYFFFHSHYTKDLFLRCKEYSFGPLYSVPFPLSIVSCYRDALSLVLFLKNDEGSFSYNFDFLFNTFLFSLFGFHRICKYFKLITFWSNVFSFSRHGPKLIFFSSPISLTGINPLPSSDLLLYDRSTSDWECFCCHCQQAHPLFNISCSFL